MLALTRPFGTVAVACVLWLGLACAPPPLSPEEVLERYFCWIGRDPARTLELLTPEFHLQHGLRLAALEGVFWGGWERASFRSRVREREVARGVESLEARVDGGRLAWLIVQRGAPFRKIGPELRVELVEEAFAAGRGFRTVRVQSKRFAPFVQRFEFSRIVANSAWRIRAIEQRDVDVTNASAAMVAYPSLANLERIKQRIPKNSDPESLR